MYEIDEIAVERAMHGDDVRLTTVERALAVARLGARGLSGDEIATRLRRSRRTIVRYRRFIRLIREAV